MSGISGKLISGLLCKTFYGGVYKGSMYICYNQVNHPDVPARNTCRGHILTCMYYRIGAVKVRCRSRRVAAL